MLGYRLTYLKPAPLPELHVTKRAYKNYLTTIQGKCGPLLSATAGENKKDRNTVQIVLQQLLHVLPEKEITESNFNETTATCTELLASSAKSLRRELLSIAILTSNYSNKARSFHSKLEEMIKGLNPNP